MDGGTSADTILVDFNKQREHLANNAPIDISRMQIPGVAQADMSVMSAQTVERLPPKIPLVMKPTLGRTVHITANTDIGRGIRLLEQSCTRNWVRKDFNKQRFHERGGLKRKRLVRERWRRRFMAGFKATIGRVKDLSRQGW